MLAEKLDQPCTVSHRLAYCRATKAYLTRLGKHVEGPPNSHLDNDLIQSMFASYLLKKPTTNCRNKIILNKQSS